MELYRDILVRLMERETIQVTFPQLRADPAEMVERLCYVALKRIKEILEDDSLDDPTCLMRIEEIVCTIEKLGSSCKGRHELG